MNWKVTLRIITIVLSLPISAFAQSEYTDTKLGVTLDAFIDDKQAIKIAGTQNEFDVSTMYFIDKIIDTNQYLNLGNKQNVMRKAGFFFAIVNVQYGAKWYWFYNGKLVAIEIRYNEKNYDRIEKVYGKLELLPTRINENYLMCSWKLDDRVIYYEEDTYKNMKNKSVVFVIDKDWLYKIGTDSGQ